MSSTAAKLDLFEQTGQLSTARRGAPVLGTTIYVAVLCLMVLCAIPYGGSDPWWKLVFTCALLALGVLWIVERLLADATQIAGLKVLLPVLALFVLALVQTIPLGRSSGTTAEIGYRLWNSISADPYETRIFAFQLLALILLAAILFRYVSNVTRMRVLIHVIIAIAVASALFGIARQTTQHHTGFLLPLLQVGQGYGQFINKNHFAYLMEVGLGLTLGLVVGGGVRRDRVLIYLAALLPIWTALVLCLSRGGLLAMLVQLVVVGLLSTAIVSRDDRAGQSRMWGLARSRVVRLCLVVALIVLVVVGAVWVGGDHLIERLEATHLEFDENFGAHLGATRVQIWQATGRMIQANPILGVGLGGYWAAIPTYHDGSGTSTPQQAHNDYLELVASGGIVGLALGIWFVVVVFRRARANLQSPEHFRRVACFAALVGIAGVAAHSLVDFGLHRMVNAMLFTALLVIATCNPKDESDRLKSNV